MKSTYRQALEIRILSSIITKTSRQALEQRMTEKGIALSMLQMGILHLVSHHAFTSSELSRKMMLDPSTLVPAMDALIRKGYITRKRDSDDRRRYLLFLTDAAHELLRDVHMVNDDDPLLFALEILGEDNSEQLRRLLRSVVERLPEGEAMLKEMEARLNLTKMKCNLE